MPVCTMWRSLPINQNNNKGTTIRFLLAMLWNDAHERLWKVPKDQKHLKEEWVAHKQHFRGWDIQCLGHWLHGTVLFFLRLTLHIGSNRLCVQVGWGVVLPTNDGRVVTQFLKKNIFTRYDSPTTIICDGGKHFCNHLFASLLAKHGVKNCFSTLILKLMSKWRSPIGS